MRAASFASFQVCVVSHSEQFSAHLFKDLILISTLRLCAESGEQFHLFIHIGHFVEAAICVNMILIHSRNAK